MLKLARGVCRRGSTILCKIMLSGGLNSCFDWSLAVACSAFYVLDACTACPLFSVSAFTMPHCAIIFNPFPWNYIMYFPTEVSYTALFSVDTLKYLSLQLVCLITREYRQWKSTSFLYLNLIGSDNNNSHLTYYKLVTRECNKDAGRFHRVRVSIIRGLWQVLMRFRVIIHEVLCYTALQRRCNPTPL